MEKELIQQSNLAAIEEFFDQCEKTTYLEFLREMFDSYVTNWRFAQADVKGRSEAVFFYRRIEELLENIQKQNGQDLTRVQLGQFYTN